MKVKIKLIKNGQIPVFKHLDDACADCYARLDKEVEVGVGYRILIPLGFAIQLPIGYEAMIRPRSGLTSKGIDNGIGTIDAGYTGEIKACVINNSHEPLVIHNGDRICQLAIRKTEFIDFEQVEELEETERGSNGFGSTGIK